ncbi:methyltransferase [Candidatus Woesearchaeota archaeon]|nr:methyltransferase [Candidatus Woesearchaeota archaeon]
MKKPKDDKLLHRQEKNEYVIKILDRDFVILPNMFSPKYFKDTEFFARELPIEKGDNFLEIGPGPGAISVIAALNGAGKVVAVDISPDSVANTTENAKRHGVTIKVYQGDVYNPLPKTAKFDKIFWNAPFGFVERTGLARLKKSLLDPNYKSTCRFIKGAYKHLHPTGKLYLGFSSTLGKMRKIRKFFREANMDYKLVAKTTIAPAKSQVKPVSYELFEAWMKKEKPKPKKTLLKKPKILKKRRKKK